MRAAVRCRPHTPRTPQPVNILSRGASLLPIGFSANSSVIILPSKIIENPQDGNYYIPYGDGVSFGLAQASSADGPWTDLGYPSGLTGLATSSQQHRVLLTPDNKWSWYLTPDQVTIELYQTAAAAPITGPYTLTGACFTQGTSGAWDAGHLGEIYVFQTATTTAGIGPAGTWAMLYRGEDNPATGEQVGLAISSGDHTGPWTKYAGNPVIPKTGLGVFDDQITADPIVVFWNGIYHLFYAYGGPNTFQGGLVGGAAVCGTALATTTDFVTFTKRGIALPTGLMGQPDCAHSLNGDFHWPGRIAGTAADLTCAIPTSASILYRPYFARNLTSGDTNAVTHGFLMKVDPQSIFGGAAAAGTPWTRIEAEAISTNLTTTGTWTYDNSTSNHLRGCTGSEYVWSNTPGDVQTLSWTGKPAGSRARVWLGEQNSNGIANILLDGVQVAQVDTFGGAGETKPGFMLGYDTGDVGPGAHTLTVEVSGTKNAGSSGLYVYIDAWECIGVTGTGLTYQQTVLADAPNGYWRLNDASGTVATDLSGNGLNGVYAGGVTLAQSSPLTDPTSKSVKLNGSTGYVYVPDNALLRLGSSFSVEAWVKESALSSAWVTKGGGTVNFFLQSLASGAVKLNVDPTHSGIGTASQISVNTWYHVVTTYDGTNVRIYLDGALVNTVAVAQSAQSTTATSLEIGSWSDATSVPPGGSGEFLSGSVTEVAVYKTVLSATRVAAHYAAGTS